MNVGKGNKTKLSHQEVAEQVLQIYTKALQDPNCLKAILSDYSVLDYFGKIFYGQENVLSQLISSLHGSNYELSSLSVNEQPPLVPCSMPVNSHQENVDDDLEVSLISPPKFTFGGLAFSTPVRKKRSASVALDISSNRQFKLCKTDANNDQGSSSRKTDDEHKDTLILPQNIQALFSNETRHLTAYGTIQYPRRVVPTMDPKRIKHHSLVTHRDRYCQLYISFECDEHVISIKNCKIRTIKYSFSSRVTPRNLLKAFNEVDMS